MSLALLIVSLVFSLQISYFIILLIWINFNKSFDFYFPIFIISFVFICIVFFVIENISYINKRNMLFKKNQLDSFLDKYDLLKIYSLNKVYKIKIGSLLGEFYIKNKDFNNAYYIFEDMKNDLQLNKIKFIVFFSQRIKLEFFLSFIFSCIMTNNIIEAEALYQESKELIEKYKVKEKYSFDINIVLALLEFKKNDIEKAKEYFEKAKQNAKTEKDEEIIKIGKSYIN